MINSKGQQLRGRGRRGADVTGSGLSRQLCPERWGWAGSSGRTCGVASQKITKPFANKGPHYRSPCGGPRMPDFDSEAVAGLEGTQLLPVRAGRVLGDYLPSPPPPPRSRKRGRSPTALARRVEAGPKEGCLAAREAGLKERPAAGPSWPAGLLAGGNWSIWKASFTLTNQCSKAKQSHSEHSQVPPPSRTAHLGVSC